MRLRVSLTGRRPDTRLCSGQCRRGRGRILVGRATGRTESCRTFASVLVTLGKAGKLVIGQMGQSDPAFTFRVYAQLVRHGDTARDALRALVAGSDPHYGHRVEFSAWPALTLQTRRPALRALL